jgi:hypothetical protein
VCLSVSELFGSVCECLTGGLSIFVFPSVRDHVRVCLSDTECLSVSLSVSEELSAFECV